MREKEMIKKEKKKNLLYSYMYICIYVYVLTFMINHSYFELIHSERKIN